MNKKLTVRYLLTVLVMAVSVAGSYGQNPTKILKSETFDSYYGAITNGWQLYYGEHKGATPWSTDHKDAESYVGYVPDKNNAGGVKAGEGGGQFVSGVPRFAWSDCWDTTNYLTLNDVLVATGRVVVASSNLQGTASTSAGTGFFPAGWGNVTNLSGNPADANAGVRPELLGNCMGLRWQAGSPPIPLLVIHAPNDSTEALLKTAPFASANVGAAFSRDQKLRFQMQWDPSGGTNGGGLFAGNLIDDANGWTFTSELHLTPTDRLDVTNCAFNFYGFFTDVKTLVNTTRRFPVYVDDLTYSACPNAAVWAAPGQLGGQSQATNIWISQNANNHTYDQGLPSPRTNSLASGSCNSLTIATGPYVPLDQQIDLDIVISDTNVCYLLTPGVATQHVVFPAGRTYWASNLTINAAVTSIPTNCTFTMRNVTGPVGVGSAPFAGGVSALKWTNVTVTVAPPFISLTPATSSVIAGSTNGSVTVSISSGANCASAVTVDLVSTNSQIVPKGSAGTLSLTFPQGGFTTTNVFIDASATTSATNTTWALANPGGPSGIAVNPAQATNRVTVTCGTFSLSPATSVASLGVTQLLTITISAGLNQSQPATVNLVSGNTSVAYPSGAPGGTVTVSIPVGAPATTNVPFTAVAAGTATFSLASPAGMGCVSASGTALVSIVNPNPTQPVCEDFESASLAAANGWVEVGSRNAAANYNFGFDSTVVPFATLGDAGGVFFRTNARGYYADSTIGTLTLNDYISASGSIYFQKLATNNADMWFGFFNSLNSITNTGNNAGVTRNLLVWELSNNAVTSMRLRGMLGDSTGGSVFENGGTTTPIVTVGNTYTWQFTYDPTGGPSGYGQAIWTLPGSPFFGYSITNNLTAANRANGAVFDRFGLLCGWRTTQATADTHEVYFDDLCYTVGGPVTINTVSSSGGNVTLSFTSAGYSHKVQQSTSLSPASWSDVTGVTFTGPSLQTLLNTAQFPVPTVPTFYRVVANPAP